MSEHGNGLAGSTLANLDNLQNWLDKREIKTVDIVWDDIAGLPRSKSLPVRRFIAAAETGTEFASTALAFDIRSVPATVSFTGAALGHPNVRLVPDLKTLRSSVLTDGTAICLGDIQDIGSGQGCPHGRAFTHRVAQSLKDAGFEARIAPELEAYLIRRDFKPIELRSHCYATELTMALSHWLPRIVDTIGDFENVEAWHHEHGPGQFEVSIEPQALLRACDSLFLIRSACRQILASSDYQVTWMAKPFSGLNGSACQINMSLADLTGRPIFVDSQSRGELSLVGKQFTAGILKHMRELTAILYPNVNSFRRLSEGHFAPLRVNWGYDNRTAAIRATASTETCARIEVRTPGADVASHILIPALISAGLDGIASQLDAPPPYTGDLERDTQGSELLCSDWVTALRVFDNSEWLRKVMTPEFHDLYSAVKWQEYRRYCGTITDFEKEEYGACI